MFHFFRFLFFNSLFSAQLPLCASDRFFFSLRKFSFLVSLRESSKQQHNRLAAPASQPASKLARSITFLLCSSSSSSPLRRNQSKNDAGPHHRVHAGRQARVRQEGAVWQHHGSQGTRGPGERAERAAGEGAPCSMLLFSSRSRDRSHSMPLKPLSSSFHQPSPQKNTY